jgi:hypothetical protein
VFIVKGGREKERRRRGRGGGEGDQFIKTTFTGY